MMTSQTFNTVAKRIRERFPVDQPGDVWGDRVRNRHERAVLTTLALDFAKGFVKDNPRFDPLKFLDACSPDVDFYPLSELWEDENE